MTRYLSLDDLLRIADASVEGDVLVRDIGLLDSALGRPRATVFGADAYPSLHLKAAALLHSLARNRTLVDGNKRLAWAATAVLLGTNGHRVVTGQDEVVDLVVAVAAGTLDDLEEIAAQLAAWSPARWHPTGESSSAHAVTDERCPDRPVRGAGTGESLCRNGGLALSKRGTRRVGTGDSPGWGCDLAHAAGERRCLPG